MRCCKVSEIIKVKDARRFVIRDRQAGNEITRARTIDRAKEIIEEFEEQDKKENIFEKDFYEIYDSLKDEIIR